MNPASLDRILDRELAESPRSGSQLLPDHTGERYRPLVRVTGQTSPSPHGHLDRHTTISGTRPVRVLLLCLTLDTIAPSSHQLGERALPDRKIRIHPRRIRVAVFWAIVALLILAPIISVTIISLRALRYLPIGFVWFAILALLPAYFVINARREDRKARSYQTITHIPRWVTRQRKKIQRERPQVSDTSSNPVFVLTGRRYSYRLTFRGQDWQLINIERKPRRYNKKLRAWE